MRQALSRRLLGKQHARFKGTGGVSQTSQVRDLVPGFFDTLTGTMDVARFRDRTPAPCHLLDGVPDDWVVRRDCAGRVMAVRGTVVAGFIRGEQFYTREQAAGLLLD